MRTLTIKKAYVAVLAALSSVLVLLAMMLSAGSASASAPTINNLPAEAVGDTIATLVCYANPGGEATDVWATYKPSASAWGSVDVVATSRTTINGTTGQEVRFGIGGLTPGTSYDYRCKADNASSTTVVDTATVTFVTSGTGPTSPPPTSSTSTTSSPPPPPADLTVAGAGDLCGQTDIANCTGTSDRVLAINPDAVFTVGDNAYPDGTLADYNSSYDPTWGRFKAKTYPAIGNHEIKTGTDAGYCSYFGTKAACPSHNRVNDLGKWRLIALDSNGTPTTADVTFLTDALTAADTAGDNTIVYFHHPRWSSPCGSCHGNQTKVDAYWKAAVNNGADIVLNGHDHHYERFAPMNATGGSAAGGLREFVVGTGGGGLDPNSTTPLATSQFRASQFGVIKLTLTDTDYSWQFVTSGGSVLDSGTTAVR